MEHSEPAEWTRIRLKGDFLGEVADNPGDGMSL